MGDFADAVLDGTLCQGCGVYIGLGGYPGYCAGCKRDNSRDTVQMRSHGQTKTPCPHCGRRVKPAGLSNHVKDAHPEVNARALKAASLMLAALVAARHIIQADRNSLAGSHRLPSGELDSDGKAGVAEYDACLFQIDNALAAAGGAK